MIQNYTITTWDGNNYTIDPVNGARLMDKWTESESSFPVDLGDAAINSSAIKAITPNRITEADMPPQVLTDAKRVEAGVRCQGKFSIQREVNNIARHDHPDNWAKLIRDKKWREKTRQELLKTTDEWCDYKSGKCAC